ncbi:MAG: flagellar basal body P-ring protein FlgI [Candidatus Latescibacteria bacterium]|nr:flagellar basal body P-ring protein FlgI [Candidatus Latescibacterota bacterium]
MLLACLHKKWLLCLALVLCASGLASAQFVPEFEPQASRLKDIGSVQTLQEVQLIGYGLVVGLEGVGDGRGAPYSAQALANLMRNMGVEVDPATIRANNAASVLVTAKINPFTRVGSKIDVTVSSVGDAASLQGGILVMTELRAAPPNGPVFAIAQGPISIGGFNVDAGGGGSVTKNHPVVGRVPNGAIIQQEMIAPGEIAGSLTITVGDPDYTTVARLARSIDIRFGARIATALDKGTVQVRVPRDYQNPGRFIDFVSQLENVSVVTDVNARVVVNERTGTIIAGQHVAIAEVAIAHGSLSISIGADENINVGGGGGGGGPQANLQLAGGIDVEEEKPRMLALPPTSSVSDVAKALNALKVTPRDIIAIFQSLKAAGALKAELIIQ